MWILRKGVGAVVTAVLTSTVVVCGFAHLAAAEEALDHPWYFGGQIGVLKFEGDEEVEDGFVIGVGAGYDYSERWTFEGFLYLAPELDGNTRNSYGVKINRLEEKAGVTDTSAVGVGVDALLHVTRWERLDPYLALGAGVTVYDDNFGNDFDFAVRVGGGVMYHFNDEWAVRADARFFIAGDDTEANGLLTGGIVWTIGAGVAPHLKVSGGILDSDGDGLPDTREAELGTDPYDPDTDKDGLSDGEEVLEYGTDPLNEDTDWDQLKDGPEVHAHGTDPNDRDTDDGGVSDGHEVLEDGTDPLDGSDDLLLFTLNIGFDTDKAIIKEQYFADLDVIGKVLARDTGAEATVEGHADQRKTSNKAYNQKLSERRAKAVLNYLVEKWGVDRKRLEAQGYGFGRPKAPNDPVNGNIENRRTEIYIRTSEHQRRAE
jgi:OOP family OmpA-OmpF porin